MLDPNQTNFPSDTGDLSIEFHALFFFKTQHDRPHINPVDRRSVNSALMCPLHTVLHNCKMNTGR